MSSNTAAKPAIVEDDRGDKRWMSMHQRFVSEAQEQEPDVVLIGDSLFSHLNVTEIWDKMFAPLHCLNFGISGDQTQNVLWRVMNGEMENMSPQVIVLCVGTNNHDHTAEETYEGVLAIVSAMRERQTKANIIVVSIPPRGKAHNKLRVKIGEINTQLSEKLSGMENTQLLTIDPGLFINPYDGTISHRDMYDYLHFTRAGSQKFCEPILEEIQTLLKDFVKSGSHDASDDVASQGDSV